MKGFKVVDRPDNLCDCLAEIKPKEFLFKPVGAFIECKCSDPKCGKEYFAHIIEVPDQDEQGSGDTIEFDEYELATILTSTAGKGEDDD